MNVDGKTVVLLVEDSSVDATLVEGLLRHSALEQFSVARCTTLAKAQSHLSNTHVDVVILDLNLPDIGGIEVLRPPHRRFEEN